MGIKGEAFKTLKPLFRLDVTAITTTTVPWKRWSNKHSYWVLLSHHFPFGCSGLESRETVTLENLKLKNGWSLWEYRIVFVNICIAAFHFFIPLLSFTFISPCHVKDIKWGIREKDRGVLPLGGHFWWMHGRDFISDDFPLCPEMQWDDH